MRTWPPNYTPGKTSKWLQGLASALSSTPWKTQSITHNRIDARWGRPAAITITSTLIDPDFRTIVKHICHKFISNNSIVMDEGWLTWWHILACSRGIHQDICMKRGIKPLISTGKRRHGELRGACLCLYTDLTYIIRNDCYKTALSALHKSMRVYN